MAIMEMPKQVMYEDGPISLEDMSDKRRIMARLANLKEAEYILRNIGVSNDMIKEDRDLVRAQVEVDKDKTKYENKGSRHSLQPSNQEIPSQRDNIAQTALNKNSRNRKNTEKIGHRKKTITKGFILSFY